MQERTAVIFLPSEAVKLLDWFFQKTKENNLAGARQKQISKLLAPDLFAILLCKESGDKNDSSNTRLT
ncbi:hypothetical protein BH10CYA1_BH10CYA1_43470 [soil metagenome]